MVRFSCRFWAAADEAVECSGFATCWPNRRGQLGWQLHKQLTQRGDQHLSYENSRAWVRQHSIDGGKPCTAAFRSILPTSTLTVARLQSCTRSVSFPRSLQLLTCSEHTHCGCSDQMETADSLLCLLCPSGRRALSCPVLPLLEIHRSVCAICQLLAFSVAHPPSSFPTPAFNRAQAAAEQPTGACVQNRRALAGAPKFLRQRRRRQLVLFPAKRRRAS